MRIDGWDIDQAAGAMNGQDWGAAVPLPILLDWSERLRASTVELRAACMEARAHARDLRLRTAARSRRPE